MISLEAKSLTISKGGTTILQDISISLPEGKLVALTGPNGAGKTTLLRALAGLDSPDSGTILLDGDKPLTKLSDIQRAKKIAWVPDETHVPFAFPVIDTVVLGRFPWHLGHAQKQDFDAANRALKLLGIENLRDRLITSLSSGERKKVLIARALAGDSEIVLLDEPMANLDISAALRLCSDLKALTSSGKTICAAFHDLNLAHRFADYGILISKGEVASSGEIDVSLSPELISEVFGVHAKLQDSGDLFFKQRDS